LFFILRFFSILASCRSSSFVFFNFTISFLIRIDNCRSQHFILMHLKSCCVIRSAASLLSVNLLILLCNDMLLLLYALRSDRFGICPDHFPSSFPGEFRPFKTTSYVLRWCIIQWNALLLNWRPCILNHVEKPSIFFINTFLLS
jgi:hypothetical protein